jgi:hypothetical protein
MYLFESAVAYVHGRSFSKSYDATFTSQFGSRVQSAHYIYRVEPCLYKGLSSSADAHFQLSIVRIWRSGGAAEQGPAEGQVGTGEDQVSTANLFTLYLIFFHRLVLGFPTRNAV